MELYKTKDGQSIFDIALQKYGDTESAINIIVNNLNAIININNGNISGLNISVDESNKKIVRDFSLQNKNINTSDPVIKDGYSFDYGFTVGFFS